MARIGEELLLLLLDNAAAQPRLERTRRERLLSAAVLLDLAYACMIRPSLPADPVADGRLVVLTASEPADTLLAPALNLLARKPITAAGAITRLHGDTERRLLIRLEDRGELRRVRLCRKGFKQKDAWPLTDRTRAARARSALLATLFDDHRPDPTTAAIVSLLYAADGLDALLSLDQRGWQWVEGRAGEIASGSWVDEDSGLPEVNLAVTTAAVRTALV
jgi:hypothetical protein